MSKPKLFPASVVGSLPRPAFVLDLINERPPLSAERPLSPADQKLILDFVGAP